uniref:Uncharacterized protein n=1 Tax=Aegilops tauschii subsp. strangulata TaxID=200361 RepID=A0A452YZQ8_AEGTS
MFPRFAHLCAVVNVDSTLRYVSVHLPYRMSTIVYTYTMCTNSIRQQTLMYSYFIPNQSSPASPLVCC